MNITSIWRFIKNTATSTVAHCAGACKRLCVLMVCLMIMTDRENIGGADQFNNKMSCHVIAR